MVSRWSLHPRRTAVLLSTADDINLKCTGWDSSEAQWSRSSWHTVTLVASSFAKQFGISVLDKGLARMTEHDPVRARGVRHYFHSMTKCFEGLSQKLKRTGTVVCIIGNSKCCDVPIPTADILIEIASERFVLNSR